MRKLIVVALLFLSTWAGATTIEVLPSATVAVGNEVFFNATDFTVAGATLRSNGMVRGSYVWDFGDGYSNNSNEDFDGTAISHYFVRPGEYIVTLTVTDIYGVNDSNTVTITVTGNYSKLPPKPNLTPVLELKFEDNLTDDSGNGGNAVWVGSANYTSSGADGNAADFTDGAYILVDDNDLLDGFTNGMTISLWAKKAATANYGYFVHKGGLGYYSQIYLSGSNHVFRSAVYTDTSNAKPYSNFSTPASNIQWHHYIVVYENDVEVRIYIDGEEYEDGSNSPKALSGDVVTNTSKIGIGADRDGGNKFVGYIDEVKIYNRALTEAELFTMFELRHADFHGHTAQYIYAQIPDEYTADATNKIVATVTDDGVYSDEIYNESSLESEEEILLTHSTLDAANYTLTVELKDSGNTVLDTITETWTKDYDGSPTIGIDENLAIIVNDSVFFPVTPYGLPTGSDTVASWNGNLASTYINSLYHLGFSYGATYTLAEWKDSLATANTYSLTMIGPGPWEGKEDRDSNIGNLVEYVDDTKDYPALMMWFWEGEPSLSDVPSNVIRAWNYKSHELDPNHLTKIHFVGKNWLSTATSSLGRTRRRYEYLYNSGQFGGKGAHVADVYGLDYYPVDWRTLYSATMAKMATVLDAFAAENPYVPFTSFVETANIGEGAGTPAPTADQLKMLTWLNVIHGAKGINWFHYFSATPAANFAVMAEFLTDITALTPYVLSGDTVASISDDADVAGNRVDTMVKVANGNFYIFAVRITETTEAQSNDEKTVTFTIAGVNDVDLTVYDESRTVTVTGNVFTDDFIPNAVHIYSTVVYNLTRPAVPTSLVVDSNTYNSITVSWSGTASAYDITIDETTEHLNTTSPYEITGLSSNTSYDIDVWGKSAAGMRSLTADELTTSTKAYLSARYKMDDAAGQKTVTDSSGNSLDGTAANNITSTTGRIGNTIIFDGSTDYVRVANNSAFDSTSGLTVSCWAKSDNALVPDGTEVILASKWSNTDNKKEWKIGFSQSEKFKVIITEDGIGGANQIWKWNADSVSISTDWHHYAFTFDAGTCLMYLDGQVIDATESEGNSGTAFYNGTSPVLIGAMHNNLSGPSYGGYFDGNIDDVQIYNLALTSGGVYGLYRIELFQSFLRNLGHHFTSWIGFEPGSHDY